MNGAVHKIDRCTPTGTQEESKDDRDYAKKKRYNSASWRDYYVNCVFLKFIDFAPCSMVIYHASS